MKVLSVFDGISCGRVALERLGLKDVMYYASEIKETALKVSRYHYPDTVHLGCVRDVVTSDLPIIDLFIGGSPCKGISRLNQKQNGLDHHESILFWEWMRIYKELKAINPGLKYLLENTPGNKAALNVITKELGHEPLRINSRIFTAQNRPRLYWTNLDVPAIPDDKGLTTKTLPMYIKQYYEDLPMVPDNRVRWLESESGKKSVRKGYTKINPYPKYGCITANGHKKWNENYLLIDGRYYFLSQFELEWLQTLPAGYTGQLSYEEAYDVIGDAWTVDVICHLFESLKQG